MKFDTECFCIFFIIGASTHHLLFVAYETSTKMYGKGSIFSKNDYGGHSVESGCFSNEKKQDIDGRRFNIAIP